MKSNIWSELQAPSRLAPPSGVCSGVLVLVGAVPRRLTRPLIVQKRVGRDRGLIRELWRRRPQVRPEEEVGLRTKGMVRHDQASGRNERRCEERGRYQNSAAPGQRDVQPAAVGERSEDEEQSAGPPRHAGQQVH